MVFIGSEKGIGQVYQQLSRGSALHKIRKCCAYSRMMSNSGILLAASWKVQIDFEDAKVSATDLFVEDLRAWDKRFFFALVLFIPVLVIGIL